MNRALFRAAIVLCRPSKTGLVRAALPMGVELVTLPITSANVWLTPWLPHGALPPNRYLLAIVSHWPEFLSIARTMLAAAGISSDALIFCDASQPNWLRGLDAANAILCDAYTATLPTLPRTPRTITFPLLAESCRDLLRVYEPRPL